MRAFRGYSSDHAAGGARLDRTFHSLQLSFNRRFSNGLSFGFNDTIPLSQIVRARPRGCSTTRTAPTRERADQAEADELLGNVDPDRHILKGNFVWDLPDVAAASGCAQGAAATWSTTGSCRASGPARPGTAYTVGVSATRAARRERQPEPHRLADLRRAASGIVGDPGAGLQPATRYRQFNTGGVRGPAGRQRRPRVRERLPARLLHERVRHVASRGTSGSAASRSIQLRVDMFNAPNQAIDHGAQHDDEPRRARLDPATMTNLPFDAAGNLIASRSLPQGRGFGVANAYQAPRTMQAQIRFSF